MIWKKLSDGVEIYVSEGDCILLKGALLAAVADTPASHQFGGFKEGVGGAYAKCRQCDCSVEDMQGKFIENALKMHCEEK